MGEIQDAVIVAAGLGTRMLPASAAIGKEALPLIDVPGLFHLVWESLKSGCKRIHLVISPQKENFVNILKPSSDLIQELQRQVDNLSIDTISPISDGIEVITHYQEAPRGLMDAIGCATKNIEGAFLVLLGDNLLIKDHKVPNKMNSEFGSTASLKLVSKYKQYGRPVVGVKSVREKSLSKYGVVKLKEERIIDIIEKPNVEEAPSNMVLCGRYIFTSEMIDLMDTYTFEEFGELQSIVIQKHCMKEEGGLLAVPLNDYQWYDSGNPLSWIKSQLDHAMRRDDIGIELTEWMLKRLEDENYEIN
jgi:UTP--glucose-1-phosphate uridylyltransferase